VACAVLPPGESESFQLIRAHLWAAWGATALMSRSVCTKPVLGAKT